MRTRYARLCVYVLPLVIGLALSGCDAIQVGPNPTAYLDIAYVYPSAGLVYNSTTGSRVTAQAGATTDYINARGSVYNPSSGLIGLGLNTSMSPGELYMPSMPMRVEFTVEGSGTYRSEFSFVGLYSAPSRTTPFIVNTGFARPSAAPESPVRQNRCRNDDCGTPVPPPPVYYLMHLPLPDKSREPFLNFTNEPDGNISRGDLERRASAWPQSTRDNLSAFFSAVYDKDISALAGSTPGYRASGDPADRYRAAAAALDAREPSASGTRWIDTAEPLIARLTSSPDASTTVAGKDGEARNNPAATASASPNPATTFVTIRAADAETAGIFDLLGRRVAQLTLSGGLADWDLRDASGQRVPAGIYVIQIVGSDHRVSRRVTVL